MSPIDRVVIGRATIRIQLSEVSEENDSARILTLPWTAPSPYRKREIIQGANDAKTYARPMALSHQPFLLLTTCPTARLGFNKFNGLASRQNAAREPLLARCPLNEPVAKIARALKRTMERRVKRLNVTDLSLKLWPQKPASPKNGLGRASRGAADF